MKEKLSKVKAGYHENPGWYWLMATIFLFPILPEYVSPFILFIGFLVFKRQWTREGKKAKVGTLGKLIMVFMTLSLVSVLWSETKFSTLATAALWWGMFLIQVMIFNLARTREKIDTLLKLITASASLNGLVGSLQIISYTLYKFGYITKSQVFVTPFYKPLDKAVYTWLPFDINTTLWWDSRASGFFSNPNLLATFMIIAYPISIYLFINCKAKSKSHRITYFIANVLISCGMSATLTRAGCVIALAGWLFMFIILLRHQWKNLLEIFIPTACVIIPSILTRYGIIFASRGNGEEAKKSTDAHLAIWQSLCDYIISHLKVFFIGTGFGIEQTGIILSSIYALEKPHAHNFVIEIWMELGIVGVAIFALIIVWAFGKLLEINANNGKKFTLVFCIFTSMLLYLLFGLTDYIFNSPKQIILLFILLGLTQAISVCYDKTLITDAKSLKKVALKELENAQK